MLRIDTTIVNFLPSLVAPDVGEVPPNWVNKQPVPFYFRHCLFPLVVFVISMS